MPDDRLAAACLSGNADAWDALVERYESFVYSLLLRQGVSRADADDLFQDVFLLLYRHLGDVRDTEKLAGWLASTTKREIWRFQRRRAASPGQMPEEEWQMERAQPVSQEEADRPDEQALKLEDQRMVRVAMDRLQDRCRELLSLLYVRDPPLAYNEAADALNMPIGSIGPTRARCLQRLLKSLRDLGF